jgi:hypothetical protein
VPGSIWYEEERERIWVRVCSEREEWREEGHGEESKREREEEGEEWVKYLASNFTKMPPII